MHSPSVAVGPSRSPRPSQAPSKGGQPHAPKPEIVWKPIPFSEKRKQQMVVYAKRHYGMDAWQLKDPKVIVEHFTAGSTFESAFATFASNKPDLGELPGTCAHFVVDRDGTIYQLVKLDAMCRHTVGLNYTAIGIEMVGMSDAQVMRDHKQYEAAQNLTLWLMQRYGIALDNVIGHSESLTSPYHQEAVKSWQCQTHADWIHSDMQVFRKDLAALANRFDVPLGKPVKRVNPNC